MAKGNVKHVLSYGFFSDSTSDGITDVSDDDEVLDMVKELDDLLNTYSDILERDSDFIEQLLEDTANSASCDTYRPCNNCMGDLPAYQVVKETLFTSTWYAETPERSYGQRFRPADSKQQVAGIHNFLFFHAEVSQILRIDY